MPGPPRKPDSERRGHRDYPVATLAPVERVPDLPRIQGRWTVYARERWESFWQSDVAGAVDVDSDLPALYRWAVALDEYQRCVRAVRRAGRVVQGARGPSLNPLVGYVKQLEADLRAYEAAFGMTPASRLKLGVQKGKLQVTAARLNAMVDVTPHDDPDLVVDYEAS